MANFSLSGKIPVLNTWFINKVIGVMIVGDICFKNSVEMLSNPQDALFGRLSIILETYCSSTLFNANLQFMLSFK